MVQRKAERSAAQATAIPQSGGSPLPNDVQAKMAPKLGADLSGVRVHTNGESAQAAKDLGARAFTVDHDVHFNAGQFAPGTREGDRLLAHELTHVVQGQKAGVQRKAAPEGGGEKGGGEKGGGELEVSQPEDSSEKEADSVADGVTDQLHGGGEKDGDQGGEQPIELPPEVRGELTKELGELPQFEVLVAPQKVPKGEAAFSDGTRLYVREAKVAHDPRAIKDAVGKIAQKNAGPKAEKPGAVEQSAQAPATESPAAEEKPVEIGAQGGDVARKISLSPEAGGAEPMAEADALEQRFERTDLDGKTRTAIIAAYTNFGLACKEVGDKIEKEQEANAAMGGLILESLIGIAMPMVSGVLSSWLAGASEEGAAVQKAGAAVAKDSAKAGKAGATVAKDSAKAGKAGATVAKEASKGLHIDWSEIHKAQIDGVLDPVGGKLKEMGQEAIKGESTVKEFLLKVSDKEMGVMLGLSDSLAQQPTGVVQVLHDVFSQCTQAKYQEHIERLARQFQGVNAIGHDVLTPGGGPNLGDVFGCWLGHRGGPFILVERIDTGANEGRGSFVFVDVVEDEELQKEAQKKTANSGFFDDAIMQTDQVDELPKELKSGRGK